MGNLTERTKIIAFYLPQFHTIPENDQWWGKGFTEWTNLRRAESYRKEQCQPREPLNDNYYDLSDINTLRWQSNLAKKYGVDGFCFYHYWFKGKLLLEKPAENLLKTNDIDLNFCFSWANEPWARTWDGKNNQVLMSQEYGDKQDWEKHFEYLLPFFKDRRYIKEDNKPMFLIYKSSTIDKCGEMMDLWNEMAIKNNFNGIHFVETIRESIDKRDLPFSARVEFEPFRTLFNRSKIEINYDRIRRRILNVINVISKSNKPLNRTFRFSNISRRALDKFEPEGTYGGLFLGWDNAPRRGIAGTFITEATKEEFKQYLINKIKITQNIYKTDYIFINSWNEWCEGTYLEPDKTNRYKYLEVINDVIRKDDLKYEK